MSFIRLGLQTIGTASRTGLQRVISARSFSQSFVYCHEEQRKEQESEENELDEVKEGGLDPSMFPRPVDPLSDRSNPIPVETSIKYMQSNAYNKTYGDDPIWKSYRRNYGKHFIPKRTRKTCIRSQVIATTNPCPICRDEYLVLDHRNTKLLHQFISPFNGEIISYSKTGLCQRQHQNLQIAIHRAKDLGTISFDVPFRVYDYSEWYKPESKTDSEDKK